MKKQLLVINLLSDTLELRLKDPLRLDEEIIKDIIDQNKSLKKNLGLVSYLGRSLKLKKENPTMTKREIINLILKEPF